MINPRPLTRVGEHPFLDFPLLTLSIMRKNGLEDANFHSLLVLVLPFLNFELDRIL